MASDGISRRAVTLTPAIPGAHLMILPGVSHFAMIQNPPLFARAVLDELTAPWDD